MMIAQGNINLAMPLCTSLLLALNARWSPTTKYNTLKEVPKTLPYPTLPYPTLPYPSLPYPTLPYPTLPYPTLPYPTLPYPAASSKESVSPLLSLR